MLAVLFVFWILIIGHRYIDALPAKKALLKRSTGWESYAILGRVGISWIIQTACFLTILLLIFLGFLAILDNIAALIGYDTSWQDNTYDWLRSQFMAEYLGIRHLKPLLLLVVFTFFSPSDATPANKRKDIETIKTYDSTLNVILTAMDRQIPVKISLKSRKVYIGTVYSEQFEQLNFDNLAIIPQLSGYRDKDTLKISFDCNYSTVYQKHGLLDAIRGENTVQHTLSEFLISIKMSEIESISYFNHDMFDDFNHAADDEQKKPI